MTNTIGTRVATRKAKVEREYKKLDEEDQEIFHTFIIRYPAVLKSWAEFLASDYRKRNKNIDAAKLYREAKRLESINRNFKTFE